MLSIQDSNKLSSKQFLKQYESLLNDQILKENLKNT